MDPRVQHTLHLIQSDIRRETQITDAARELNISYSRLRHKFKTEVGVSPSKYLKDLRLRKAQELLETTYLSVKEIMTAVGFSDLSHFVRHFKQAYGLTPTQHRSLHYKSSKTTI